MFDRSLALDDDRPDDVLALVSVLSRIAAAQRTAGGVSWQEVPEFRRALGLARDLTRDHAESAAAHFALAQLYAVSGDLAAARAAASTAARLEPGNADFRSLLHALGGE